jgi:hypothetical protein
MGMGVLSAGTAECQRREAAQSVLGQVEVRMLTGGDDRRRKAAAGESACNRLEFDRLGPGPNDQPDFSGTQPSP